MAAVLSFLAFVALGLMAVARFGVLTDTGRAFVERHADGLSLGPAGRLRVRGLKGDVWTAFSLDDLALVDSQGAWLEAHHVQVEWSPEDLLNHRAHIDRLFIDHLVLAHRPAMAPNQAGAYARRSPLALRIDRLRTRLETLPAFSVERGRFNLDAGLDLERDGGVAGELALIPIDRPSDGLKANFDLGVGKQVVLDATAHESRGGALAGILGLPTAAAFNLAASADGNIDSGRLKLSAASGATAIAQADGAWSPTGGDLQGSLSLAASNWTAHLQSMLGPRLAFVAHQDKTRDQIKPITAQIVTDNVSLALAGPIDAARRRTDAGLTVQLRVKDVSRLGPHPQIGPGRFDGRVTGGLEDWEAKGQFAAENLAFDSYTLGRLAGPLRIARHGGELRLTASGDGVGGTGGGPVGALIGARPHGGLDLSRLADGRLLLRDLKGQGAGATLSATGSMGLFGDLKLAGDARVSNLAVAQPGARGLVEARWSAVQARASQGWRLDVTAEATDLASGETQIDHLLGAKPRLVANAVLDPGSARLEHFDLVGAAASATGAGALDTGGAVRLALDWSAQGPLALGPVEISGKAHGVAAVSGTLAAPRAELSAEIERADLPGLPLSTAHLAVAAGKDAEGVTGEWSVTADDAAGPARAHSRLRLRQAVLELDELDAVAGGVAAQGSMSLSRTALVTADLNLTLGPGAFVSQGRATGWLKLADRAGVASASLGLTADNLLLKGSDSVARTLEIKADGPRAALPYSIAGELDTSQGPLVVKGGGVAGQSGRGLNLSFNGVGRFRKTDFHTLGPALIDLQGDDRTARLDLAVGGGRAQIQADQNGADLTAQAALTAIDLSTLGEDIVGHVDANLTLVGQADHLAGRLDAHLKGARSSDAPAKLALNGAVSAVLAGPQMTVDAQVSGAAPGDQAQVHAVLPAVATATPLRIAINRTQPISGAFTVNGELQPIWDLFFGGGRELAGQVSAAGGLGGSLNSPQVTGRGSLSHGRFEDSATGLKLREVTAEVELQGQAINVRRFSANDAHAGVLTGQGRLEVGPSAASTLTLNAHSFQLLDNELAKATASGVVTVVREPSGEAKVTGDLTLDRADIAAESTHAPPGVVTMEVVERNKPYVANPPLQVHALAVPEVDLDVRLKAPRRVFVRGLGLDAELSLDAHVVGTIANPVLQGTAGIVRGDYDFAGKRFTIDDRGLVYLASTPEKMRLDLTATEDDPALTAIIRIQGTAAKPQITLTSTPVLPEDEVLSQVLFGASAAQLSPVEAAQLAAALTTLATGGGFDIMGGLKNFARLDRLALTSGDSTTASTVTGGRYANTGVSVSGGKYIGSKVYLELTGGGRQGASAQVEYKATKALSLISQVGGETGAKLAVRWRKDYGRAPSGPK